MTDLVSSNTKYVSSEFKYRALRNEAKEALKNNAKAMELAHALFEKCIQIRICKPFKLFCKDELKALNEDQDFLAWAGFEALIYRTIFRLGVEEFKARLKKVKLTNGQVLDQETVQLILEEARIKKDSLKLKLPDNQAFLKYIIKIKEQNPESFIIEVRHKNTPFCIPKTEASEFEGYVVAISDQFARKFGSIKEFKRS